MAISAPLRAEERRELRAIIDRIIDRQQPKPVSGKIATFISPILTVDTEEGTRLDIEFILGPVVGAYRNIEPAALTVGAIVNTMATPAANGDLIARNIVILPEPRRGLPEGQHLWPPGVGSILINGTVESVIRNSAGRDLNIGYSGQRSVVHVPLKTPIIAPIAAEIVDLVPGARVFVPAVIDDTGKISGLSVVVEKDGVAPPLL